MLNRLRDEEGTNPNSTNFDPLRVVSLLHATCRLGRRRPELAERLRANPLTSSSVLLGSC